MDKKIIFLWIATVAVNVLAQESNGVSRSMGDGRGAAWKNRGRVEEQRREYEERKYQFMDKALTRIGVSDEDKLKIRALQDEHREKMRANMDRTAAAREKLSQLQENDSSEAEIDSAIREISDAQAEQLKILVNNRMEMEKILGKEKYARFMEVARMQFRMHDGHRGGFGLPPRPDLPPRPGMDEVFSGPPGPPTGPPPQE